ncbi:MAG: deoxyguanosinetriphosphate triphosphohydrolase [Candidatus Zixiibacteriota bacterium]|nr:MAG: deoxyguanosinetriphosphate triphosphohydrolase [candidate division Zixibacteria bacterium]
MLRIELENLEKRNLASFALKSGESRGRCYDEPKHPYRTEFQRDRDRIVHSTAFRRLQYKTQVFVNHEGDHYRTRLTHTMEAAIIARSIARALRVNEDLTEAIALAHDLGHTPFGHSGEEALNELLKKSGGFEHNRQCLRVVDYLERRYPGFPGLNLTYELREGLLKHKTDYDHPDIPDDLKIVPGSSVECQVVNFADEIAYNCHDVDDGLSSGVLNFDQLNDSGLCKKTLQTLKKEYPDIEISLLRRILVRNLINQLVTDLVNTSRNRLEKYHNLSAAELRQMNIAALSFSSEIKALNDELKNLLGQNLYHHPRMVQNAQRAKEIIKYLFEKYLSDPDLIPAHFKSRIRQEPLNIIAADYIAGMTDRFAALEFEKIKE